MKTNQFGEPLIPCKICNNLTSMLGTKLCNRCWELNSRIRNDLDIAKKILQIIDMERKLEVERYN